MLLLVGLGNPGSAYQGQRHNIGFMAVDRIVDRHRFDGWRSSKFQGQVAQGQFGSEKILLLKPTTYMNESGNAVGAAMRFFNLDPGSVWVFHDDLDLVAGKLRVKRGGGHGGHNGLRSLDAHIGPDYRRVRMGIGHPGHKDRVHAHVLSDFAKSEQAWLEPLLDAVADAALLLASPDEQAFANKVTVTLNPPVKNPAPPKPKAADA
jgi:PTH1 family peptidyl-tRNA hydrolase